MNYAGPFITDMEERSRILSSCHSDPTSGHLDMKKSLARVTARFIGHGIVKEVNTFVSISPSMEVL